jgi:hypothetical protein
MSSHAANACGLDARAFLKSAGTSCTTPLEIFLCDKISFPFVSSTGGPWRRTDAQVNSALEYGSSDRQTGSQLLKTGDLTQNPHWAF